MFDNPTVKVLAWLAAGAVTLVGLAIGVDERYAHAAEINKLDTKMEYFADRQSKRYIDDQLFRLEQISQQKLTDSERAQIAKYKRELKQLTDRWTAKGMPLQ